MQYNKNLIALGTIIRKELRRAFRIWSQTLLPPVITTILYFVIFGKVIGHRIGLMEGVTYIQFVAPGLIMLSIINASYSASVASFFSSKFQRSLEEQLVAPISNSLLLLGYAFGGVIRGFIIGLLVAIVAVFFTHFHLHSFIIAFFVVFLSSAIFSMGGIINAIFSNKFDDIAIIPTFILTPLTYLGGVFYSLKFLPTFWQYVSMANPIVYIVGAFRYGFLGIPDRHLTMAFLVMIICTFLLFFFALYLLKKGIGLKS